MDSKKKRLAAAAASLLAVGGLGAGVAVAGSNGAAQPATVRIQPAAAQTPASAPVGTGSQSGPTAQTPEPTGPDRDNIQEGDQNAPDDANEANEANEPKEANEPNEANEKEGTEQEGTEKAGTEERGDQNLPGGGHADPQGQNVDHQFQGVE